MTVDTNAGREAIADHLMGGFIDTIAVGTGTQGESTGLTALANEVYRNDTSTSIVRFEVAPDTPGVYEAIIEITGGDEVPAGTEITEVGVIIGTSDTLTQYDTSGTREIEAGHTTEITTPLRPPGV